MRVGAVSVIAVGAAAGLGCGEQCKTYEETTWTAAPSGAGAFGSRAVITWNDEPPARFAATVSIDGSLREKVAVPNDYHTVVVGPKTSLMLFVIDMVLVTDIGWRQLTKLPFQALYPKVIFDGLDYQVFWTDYEGLKQVTVTEDGTVSGPFIVRAPLQGQSWWLAGNGAGEAIIIEDPMFGAPKTVYGIDTTSHAIVWTRDMLTTAPLVSYEPVWTQGAYWWATSESLLRIAATEVRETPLDTTNQLLATDTTLFAIEFEGAAHVVDVATGALGPAFSVNPPVAAFGDGLIAFSRNQGPLAQLSVQFVTPAGVQWAHDLATNGPVNRYEQCR